MSSPSPAPHAIAAVALDRIEAALAAIESLRQQAAAIDRIAERLAERLRSGGTLYTAGNGGSAAEALHLAEELIGRYRTNRPPLRAVSLVADPTALTCIANDFGFAEIFARPCAALVRGGDVLFLFSTSGRSENLLRAAAIARAKGALVVGLLGPEGGPLAPLCDEVVLVRGRDSAAIQEAHQVVLHAFCERLERTAADDASA
jgi:D-sedoheptulose 7-phosphate isomerase